MTNGILRARDGHEAKVTAVELFFDLVYVFSVTQLSHHLLHHLSFAGAAETLLLWFAVWLGWQYTCWMTNWFDPGNMRIRLMLFGLMIAGLVMAAAIPAAFQEGGLLFAAAYVSIQFGRSLYVTFLLERGHALNPNFRRILGWLTISSVFWIAGGFAEGGARFALWAVAVLCEYVSPMMGFWLPGLGRSRTSDWTIEGGHLAERCQLFVIVALGEAILLTGATMAGHAHWDAPTVIAFLVVFLISLAMWWIYFDTSSHDGTHAIMSSKDPGRMGAYFHYVHVVLVGGIILAAVAAELVLEHPDARIDAKYAAILIGGPFLYMAGNAVFKRIIYGRYPVSHLAGLAALIALVPVAFLTDLLMVSGLSALVLIGTGAWETYRKRC